MTENRIATCIFQAESVIIKKGQSVRDVQKTDHIILKRISNYNNN